MLGSPRQASCIDDNRRFDTERTNFESSMDSEALLPHGATDDARYLRAKSSAVFRIGYHHGQSKNHLAMRTKSSTTPAPNWDLWQPKTIHNIDMGIFKSQLLLDV